MTFSVCFVTAELAPQAKVGGLADVAAALTRLLHDLGHRVLPFLPLYADLDRDGVTMEPIEGLEELELAFGPHRYVYRVLRGRRRPGLPDLMLVDCPALFARPGFYGDAPDEHLRFLLLCRASLETCHRLQFSPDIVHCHDWHTALLPLYLKLARRTEPLFERARSLLTIHNLGYQGVLPATAADELGLGTAVGMLDAGQLCQGRINLLGQGLRDADMVSTVSPTYAKEICTPEQGMGLDGVLRARGEPVAGILNGVDAREWDPATDRYLPWHFSAEDLSGKTRMRTALCERLGLDPDAGRPLVGIVTRLAWQKGIDLLFDVLPAAVARGELALAVLGSGERECEEFFSRLASAHPRALAFRQGHDEELAHWIEAGCDAFLMPSRYEPCGLNQMYSLRYGTVPIVRRTGGLADSVRHYDAGSGEGTGIVFNDADAGAVRWALSRACELYANSSHWSRLVANGMAEDFSWDRQFERYLELYAAALRKPA
jgi:starch synthase